MNNRKPNYEIPVYIVVGAEESDAFVSQSDELYRVWLSHLPELITERAGGRNHFNVLDELANRDSCTFQRILEMTR